MVDHRRIVNVSIELATVEGLPNRRLRTAMLLTDSCLLFALLQHRLEFSALRVDA